MNRRDVEAAIVGATIAMALMAVAAVVQPDPDGPDSRWNMPSFPTCGMAEMIEPEFPCVVEMDPDPNKQAILVDKEGHLVATFPITERYTACAYRLCIWYNTSTGRWHTVLEQ